MAQLEMVYLARHGETAWSMSGQHTGLTDLPLTDRGKRNAERLGQRLAGIDFAHVLSSPLQRARTTCELAGFGNRAVIDPDLVEWNYGEYEGLTSKEIHQKDPTWQLFRDGCPQGESVQEIGARADRVLARLKLLTGKVLLFSSGHILRVLGARWVGLPPSAGGLLFLSTASVCCLGYEHQSDPVIRLWNDDHHAGP